MKKSEKETQTFMDYQKAVEFIITKQKCCEIWEMTIAFFENQKAYILEKVEEGARV